MSDDIKTKQIKIKEAFGLENLDFYTKERGRYYCRYISNPNDFDISKSLDTNELKFILNALSMAQGVVFFEDCGQSCKGISDIKAHYLPMKLAGL